MQYPSFALGLAVILGVSSAPGMSAAEPWSRARINALPDSAFAVVEIDRDGRKVRHLPHHDESGAVDLPHLRAARSRLGQVIWLDLANEIIAREHLEAHERRRSSSSSSVRGQSSWSSRESERSASSLPPVWQRGQ